MKLTTLLEMPAAKLCDKCGKTMAANHYWYKGGWRCKAAKPAEDADSTPPQTPAEVEPAPTQQATQTPAPNDNQPAPQRGATPPQTAVQAQPLEIEVEVIEEALPTIEAELAKINKTAARVGAKAVEMTIVGSRFKEVIKNRKDDLGGVEPERFNQKMVTVKLVGTTPRIQGADGSTWNFVGVITPSAQGAAILKLTPGASDTDALRKLHSTNPYYCDYCRKVRMRNETFIVNNGNEYRQVGRNCLKDFVGGANPQALLQYFEFFNDREHFESWIYGKMSTGGSEDGGFGGGGRGNRYYEPQRILATTIAAVEVYNGYVSAKAEHAESTASHVRMSLWGMVTKDMPKEEIDKLKQMRQLADSEEYKAKADQVITWFNSLPAETIKENTFFSNIKVMVDEDAVRDREVGYIVGLYAAYERAQGKEREKKQQVSREWPEDWGDGPKAIDNMPAVVTNVREINGQYGTSQLVTLAVDGKYGVTWFYNGKYEIKEGKTFNLSGELVKDEYRTPATIKFVPSRKWIRTAFAEA